MYYYYIDVNICYKDYPASITVTSTGPAAVEHPYLMGVYDLDPTLTAQLRPVYKKTDRDYYIFYNRKLYFILVITVSQLYLSLQLLDSGLLVLTTRLPLEGS